jgi:hypothetical protein
MGSSADFVTVPTYFAYPVCVICYLTSCPGFRILKLKLAVADAQERIVEAESRAAWTADATV